MSINQHHQNYNEFSENPLSHLFYQFIETLKSRSFYKEAEDLLKVAEHYYLPENRSIITRIIIEIQKAVVSDEENKFEHLLRQL